MERSTNKDWATCGIPRCFGRHGSLSHPKRRQMKRNEYKNKNNTTTKKRPPVLDKDASYWVPLSHLSVKKALAPTEYLCSETDGFAFQHA